MISLYERPRLGKPGGDRAGPGATLTGLAAYDAAGHRLPAGSTAPGNG
jgi:hypothetical protein